MLQKVSVLLALLVALSNATLETGDYIKQNGYPFESYQVITPDGYILQLHRIPYGKRSGPSPQKRIAFVQHGIMCSSCDWVLISPDKALGFILADSGYDVWLGNFRGNKYGSTHVTLTTKDRQFWQFTWHEMGIYDLPTMIDKALSITGQNQLYYIGHSQGNTAYYVMASIKPEYNQKVKLMVALSPVVYMSNVESPLFRIIANNLYIVPRTRFGNWLGYSEFRPNSSLQVSATSKICNSQQTILKLCTDLIFLIVGYNWKNLNSSLLPMLSGHSSGSSTKQILHYVQEIRSGKFRNFDYGTSLNTKTYGSIWPPEYDLAKVTTPVALYYSSNDYLSAVKDVESLSSKLPSLVYKHLLSDHKFNHIDYMWGINASRVLYPDVIKLMGVY